MKVRELFKNFFYVIAFDKENTSLRHLTGIKINNRIPNFRYLIYTSPFPLWNISFWLKYFLHL